MDKNLKQTSSQKCAAIRCFLRTIWWGSPFGLDIQTKIFKKIWKNKISGFRSAPELCEEFADSALRLSTYGAQEFVVKKTTLYQKVYRYHNLFPSIEALDFPS